MGPFLEDTHGVTGVGVFDGNRVANESVARGWHGVPFTPPKDAKFRFRWPARPAAGLGAGRWRSGHDSVQVSDSSRRGAVHLLNRHASRLRFACLRQIEQQHAVVDRGRNAALVDGARQRETPREVPHRVLRVDGLEPFVAGEVDVALNPFHDEHEEVLTWYGKPFDRDDIDERSVRMALTTIANRRRGALMRHRASAR